MKWSIHWPMESNAGATCVAASFGVTFCKRNFDTFKRLSEHQSSLFIVSIFKVGHPLIIKANGVLVWRRCHLDVLKGYILCICRFVSNDFGPGWYSRVSRGRKESTTFRPHVAQETVLRWQFNARCQHVCILSTSTFVTSIGSNAKTLWGHPAHMIPFSVYFGSSRTSWGH